VRRAAVTALLLLFLAGCAGGSDDETEARGDRTFAVAEVAVLDDGPILLAGVATRGDWDSEDDGHCDGDGPATRDLAVVEITAAGTVDGVHSLSEDDLDGCAVDVKRAVLDEGALAVDATVRESPGLIPGEGGPESRERTYATRFEPGDDEFEEAGRYEPFGYAEVRLPDGDTVAIDEDPARQQQDADGVYTGTISLMRSREGRLVWSHPVQAVARDADLEEIGWEGGRGWEVFHDPRAGFYGFAHYSRWSGDVEAVLFRHRPNGRPDPSFGERGRVLVAPDVPWSFRTKRAVRLRGGDFVVAGDIGDNGPGRVVIRRFSSEGERRRGFDRAAASAIACRAPVALHAHRDGLLVACSAGKGGTLVARLGANGRLDPGFARGGKLVIGAV
jgi:hypothetical protein